MTKHERNLVRKQGTLKKSSLVAGDMVVDRVLTRSKSKLSPTIHVTKGVRPAKTKGQTGKRGTLKKSSLVAGDMMKDRVLTRSKSKLSPIIHVPNHRLLVVEKSKRSSSGAAAAENPKAKEKRGQDNLTHSESDQLMQLRRLFNEWAKEYGKIYSTENEQEERFQIFCSTKKDVDEANSKATNPDSSLFTLNEFADLKYSERLRLTSSIWTVPLACPAFVLEKYTRYIKYDEADLEKAINEFGKWKELHKKRYASVVEDDQRFLIFLDRMRRIDEDHEKKTGRKWTLGYTMDYMDKMHLEEFQKPRTGYIPEMYSGEW